MLGFLAGEEGDNRFGPPAVTGAEEPSQRFGRA